MSVQTIDEVAAMRASTATDGVALRAETMRAIVGDRYGSPDVLRLGEVARPVPGRGQVLVRVRAAAIFAGDVFALGGRPFMVRLMTGIRRPKHPIPGIDVAGVVETVGADVSSLHPGDEIFGCLQRPLLLK